MKRGRINRRKNKNDITKIASLFLISVLALAGVGVGYSAWIDTITIEGTVSTGYLSYDIVYYSETWAYKDLITPGEPIVYFDHELPDPHLDYYYVAHAEAHDGTGTEYDVIMTFNNAFPCAELTADFIFHYTGSIPVKINQMSFAHMEGYDFSDYLTYEAHPATWDDTNQEWIIDDTIDVGLGYQLHDCDYVLVEVYLHITDNIQEMQSKTGYFGGTIELIQWNKYTPSTNIPPVADAGGPYSGHTCVPITFDGSGSYDIDGIIVSYEWDFGDPNDLTPGSGVNPTHTYTSDGTYTVTLTVTDDDGLTDTDTATITVEEQTPPQPFFVAPNPNTMVHGEVYLEVGDFSGASVDYTMFSYSTDGTIWTVIDTDYDSSDNCNPGETIPPVEFGDGWSTIWDIDDPDNPISEGWYYVKAEMVDPCGDIGSTMISVYVDPTPPCPTLQGISDGGTVSGDVALTLATDDENIVNAIIELLPIPEYWKREVPELDQDDYCNDMDGWDLSDSACGPTAAAACLLYWNNTGLFPDLMKNGTSEYISITEFVEELARLMNLTSKGTNGSQVKRGIEAYLTRTGYGCTNANGLKVTLFKNTTANPLNYTRWREELAANEEDVIWGYTSPWANHWITATSFNTTEQTDADGNKYHEVDFMCPSFGNDTARMYDNGTLYRPNCNGFWRFPDEMITVSEKDPDEGEWFTIGESSNPDDGWLVTWDTTGYANGYYLLKAVMVDGTEWECQDVVVVKVENEVHVGSGEPGSYATIQDAITAVPPGGTVLVHDGTYFENIVIDKGLTLKAASYPVINGGGGVGITVEASDVVIQGMEITNCLTGIYVHNDSFIVQNVRLSNNAIHDCVVGVKFEDVTNSRIDDSSSFWGNYDYAIWFDSSSNNDIISNNIDTNYNGIWLHLSSNDNTISSSAIDYNDGSGIIIDEFSSGNTITSNEIHGNGFGVSGGEGIRFLSSNDNIIASNYVDYNFGPGIVIDGSSSGNTIDSNLVHYNDGTGIVIDEFSSGNTITSNEIYGNGWYSGGEGINLAPDTNNNLIYNNILEDNLAYDAGSNIWNIAITPGPNIIGGDWLGGNHWSDYTGEDVNPPYGIGDTPYDIPGGDNQDLYPLVYTPTTNIPPIADAGGPYSGHTYISIIFDGSGSYDIDGSIVSYDWDFGDPNDPTPGTGVNPTHTYTSDGIYTVTLTVTDDDGATDTDTAEVEVTVTVAHTLITDTYNSRVIEVNSAGTVVWEISGLNHPVDAKRLADGNTLIAEQYANRVIEVNSAGTIVWQITGLNGPCDVERLADGNTLIAEYFGSRGVIEVNSAGTIVWEMTGFGLITPCDVERLADGNTLITERYANRVIEVNSAGTIVWEMTGLDCPYDAERLSDGNTLIADFYNDRVIEVNSAGDIVWQKTGLNRPTDAERLADGNTLITDYNGHRVIEVNSAGTIVWEISGLNHPMDAERV